MSRGNELFMNAKWPIKPVAIIDLATNSAAGVQLQDASGLLLLAKVTLPGEAKQLAELLNWMHDLIQNHESVIREKQDTINGLLGYKQKYYDLQKRLEETAKKMQITDAPAEQGKAARLQDEAHLDRILSAPVTITDGAFVAPAPFEPTNKIRVEEAERPD